MRMVVTRVSSASVSVDNQQVASINDGYLVLLGLNVDDNLDIGKKMVDKLLKLRLFSDSDDKINLSIDKINGEVLLVSQFTLYANMKKGNRPSFVEALNGDEAYNLYNEISQYLLSKINTKFGVFGANMDVSSTNSGPVTVILDSNELF